MVVTQPQVPRLRSRKPNPRPPRISQSEELEILARDVTLELRGKHVLGARALACIADKAQCIPGIAEAAERVVDFFEDSDNGNWVDGSELFRLSRGDHLNRLKRIWRDFEVRRTTLRQYMRSTSRSKLPAGCVQFDIPKERLESTKAFISAYRHLVGGLDRLCRLVLEEGFHINGFSDRGTSLVIKSESTSVFDFASELLSHYDWSEQQASEVRSLEQRSDISEEYAKAAKSLAAAQLRHLRVLVENSIREAMGRHDPERSEKATELAVEYIGLLAAYVDEGAKVSTPPAATTVTQAA